MSSYNYKDNYWMMGSYANETMPGIELGIFEYPLTITHLVDYNYYTRTVIYSYMQEVGTNFGDSAFAEATGGLEIGKGDDIMKVSKIYPIVKNRNDVRITLYHRDENGESWNSAIFKFK